MCGTYGWGGSRVHHSFFSRGLGTSLAFTCIKGECPGHARGGKGRGFRGGGGSNDWCITDEDTKSSNICLLIYIFGTSILSRQELFLVQRANHKATAILNKYSWRLFKVLTSFAISIFNSSYLYRFKRLSSLYNTIFVVAPVR